LPVRLSEWALDPRLEVGEFPAIHPDGTAVRRTDFESIISAATREIIRQERITLLSGKPRQKVWRLTSQV
jgi:hypothetical protein